jgi:sugar phosphate isomerase/epimerase
VVHPPFRWQREYARGFREGIDRLADETHVRFAVENMFPLRVRGREVSAYQPSWDVAFDGEPYRDYTLDLSHASVAHSDSAAMLDAMGDRLSHVHLADGTGIPKDEHLVPGRGQQPCAEVLQRLGARGWSGTVVIEVNTRRALDRAEREADLAEALAFCRLHLDAVPSGSAPSS